MSRTLLWDVDTQVDFVRSDGKLAVPDAESVAPATRLSWAADSGVTHLATADDHELTDPEISHEPDFESTYPPHCLRGTPARRGSPRPPRSTRCRLSLTPYPPGPCRASCAGGASCSC